MRKQAGFSLVELMVGIVSATLLLLGVGSLITIATRQYLESWDRLRAETVLASGEHMFRQYFSQAIDIQFDVPAIPSSGNGWIKDGINYQKIADAPGDWTTLALFWREDSPRLGAAFSYGGQPRKTAVWYRRPTQTTSGVIFFSPGPDPATTPAATMTPSFSNPFIDRVSGIRIQKNQSNTSLNKTTSIDVTLRVRYHTSHAYGFNWCPMADITAGTAGCVMTPQAATRDLERTFRIVLQNELIQQGGAFTDSAPSDKEERAFGSLYFFKLLSPLKL